MKRYRLSHCADLDLDEIGDYIAEHNPTAAVRQVEKLHRKFATLARHPLLGQACDDLRRGLRMFSAGSYVIFYTPCDDGIRVVRVIHGARDFNSLF